MLALAPAVMYNIPMSFRWSKKESRLARSMSMRASLTTAQLRIVEDLSVEGAYIRETAYKHYELAVPGNSKKSRTVYRPTFDKLLRDGLLVNDRRPYFSRQHCGYFLRTPLVFPASIKAISNPGA